MAQVLETLAARPAAGDARGASELYSENEVLKTCDAFQCELKTADSRLKVYITFSAAKIVKVEYKDVAVSKINGDVAEANGKISVYVDAFGIKWRKDSDVVWKLTRKNGAWLIELDDETANYVLNKNV